MANYTAPVAQKKKVKAGVYPSTHGSHESMIDKVLTEKLTKKRNNEDEPVVVCRDDDGPYITEEFHTTVHYKMADKNRNETKKVRESRLGGYLPKDVDLSKAEEE